MSLSQSMVAQLLEERREDEERRRFAFLVIAQFFSIFSFSPSLGCSGGSGMHFHAINISKLA